MTMSSLWLEKLSIKSLETNILPLKVIRAVVGVGVCGEEIAARFVSIFDELGVVAARFFLSRTVFVVAAGLSFCLSETWKFTVLLTENI